MKKFLLKAMPVLAVLAVIVVTTFAPVWAVPDMQGTQIDAVAGLAKNIWSTALLIMQILAVAAIVYAGVKYMFAAAEDKAEIKQGLVGLVVGAILVFAASSVVSFILKIREQSGIK